MMVSPSDRTVDPAATRFFYAATNAASARRSEQHSAGHILPLGYSHEKVADKIIRLVREAAPESSAARGAARQSDD